jgi:hypothetical protein
MKKSLKILRQVIEARAKPDIHATSIYGDVHSSAAKAYMRRNHASIEDLIYALEFTADQLRRNPNSGLADGYVYYPENKSLTRWTASDDSTLKASLLSIMLEYLGLGERGISDVMDAAMGENLENHLVRQRVSQSGYEGGRLSGRWR